MRQEPTPPGGEVPSQSVPDGRGSLLPSVEREETPSDGADGGSREGENRASTSALGAAEDRGRAAGASPPEAGRSRRARVAGGAKRWLGSVWIPLLICAAFVAVVAVALAQGNAKDRSKLNDEFRLRTTNAAVLMASYLANQESLIVARAESVLAGPTVTRQQLRVAMIGLGYQAAGVLDTNGRVQMIQPYVPSLIGKSYTKYENVRIAVQQNRPGLTQAAISPALRVPGIGIAVPYRTAYGRRIFGSTLTLQGPTLDNLVNQAIGPGGASVYLIDRNGHLIASTGPLGAAITPLSKQAPALARALMRHPAGGYERNGQAYRYASAPLAASGGWRLVSTIRATDLYAPLSSGESNDRWLIVATILVGLGLTGVFGVQTRRRRLSEETVHVLNAELVRRGELLDRSQELSKVGGWEWDVATGQGVWTDEVYRIYGVDKSSYHPSDAIATGIAAYDEQSAPVIEAAFQRAITDGEPYDLELGLIRPDGERIVVRTTGEPVLEDGRVVRVSGYIADITERKRAEEELVETTDLLERTQQISKTGGWEYDVATGKLTWTDEVYRIYGSERRSGPVELERAMSVFDPESAPMITAALERLVADGEPSDFEVGLIRADGRRIWVRVVAQAVIKDGRVVCARGIIADVSDRRLVEEELRMLNAELEQRVAERTASLQASNKELEEFAYSVAHDLRAPLRSIDGFSQILLEEYADQLDERGVHNLDRVCAAAQRMGTLIDEMLQLSRLARTELRRGPLDLSALAREVVEDLRERDPARSVALVIADGLTANGDPMLVRGLLENLLGNAWKFTAPHERARIEFGQTAQDGERVFFVRDDGVGFDMAYADRLFLPFQRLHRSSEFPGTGVGLATVQRIVERHGGRVWADAQPDKGATFYFTLPPST